LLLAAADGAIEAVDLQHFRLGEIPFWHRAVQVELLGRGIEFQLPDDEYHAWVEVRGRLTINLPPPSGPPVYPEVGAGDEVAAVVMIPDRRHKREAELPAMKPNVLVVGGWVEIDVVPGAASGAANRPIERSEELPPGEYAPSGQHPVLRSAQEDSVEYSGLPPGGKRTGIDWDAADADKVAVIGRGPDNVFPMLHGSDRRGI
jgi:hypothetical protein